MKKSVGRKSGKKSSGCMRIALQNTKTAESLSIWTSCMIRRENVSVSMKSIKKDMTEKMSAIQTAVSSIKAMRSDKEPDALALYKRTLNLNDAIQMITTYEQNKADALKREEERRQREEERRRQAEIERARVAEREAIRREEQIRKVEQEKAQQVVEQTPAVADDELPFEQPSTVTAFYRVVATPAELEEVEMAFNSIGIYFERRTV